MRLDPNCRAVCFDMDGTLLDTKVDYSGIGNMVMDYIEASDCPRELIDRTIPYKQVIDRWIAWMKENGRESDVELHTRRINESLADIEMERVNEAVPFPGVPEMLTALRERGYRTGVLTRGSRRYAETALRVSKVDHLLDGLVTRDDFPEAEAKPAPIAMVHMAEAIGVRPEEITYVGDHKFDWLSSVGVSAKFVAVKSGTYTEQDWRAVDPDMVIVDTAADIIRFI